MKYDYSIKLKHPRSLYCPVIKAEMSINSEEVSELSLFSKLIIWAVGKGYSKAEIADITSMPPLIIEDEVAYLSKIGLVEVLSQSIALTEFGYSYYVKIESVESFNERKEKVLINCVSGEILKNTLNVIEKWEITGNGLIMNSRIITDLYGNLNPSNSKEFLIENYELFPLSPEEKLLLDVSLKLLFEKEKIKRQYMHYEVNYVPFLLHNGILNQVNVEELQPRKELPVFEETHSLLPFMYPVQKGKLKITNLLLDSYRNLLSTLVKMEQFDNELISDKARLLIHMYKQEQKIQNLLMNDIYFDQVSGIMATALSPEYRKEKNIRNEVEVLPNYDSKDILYKDFSKIIENLIGIDIEKEDWNLQYIVEEEFYLKVMENPSNILSVGCKYGKIGI